jgi:hypothetical protein
MLPVAQDRRCQLTIRDRFDYVDERMKKYDFWIYTAQVGISSCPCVIRADCRYKACRMLNNFSSTSAIVTTLLSPNITSLPLTCDNKTANQVLHGLAKELSDASYRNVIQKAGTKQLIPWLGTIGLKLDHHYLTSMFIP